MQQVIYAWNYLQWGGAQTYFLSLIRTVRDKFDILIILPEGSNEQLLKFIRDEGVRYEFFSPSYDAERRTGLTDRVRARWRKIQSEAALLRKLNEHDLENSIVHVELAPWYSLFALVWLSLRTKVFITMHNALETDNPLRKLLWKLKLRAISHFENFNVFASNEHSKSYFRGLYSDRLFESISVTYTNVDASEVEGVLGARPSRAEMCERYGLPGGKFLFFCVGQFIDRKGRWVYLEAAKRVRESDPEVAFVWIANSPPSERDLKRSHDFGLGDDFVFITSDRIGDKHIELMRLLSVADGFVLASYIEGLPISLLEAMSLGIPSISTNVYAIPETLKDEETGLLIEPGDPEALADAMRRIKNDRQLAENVSRKGSDFVMANFTDREVGKIALERYLEAASQ
ncbi:MAG: glycosyltransferase family 1 protein [Acidobacteria bacterium]|nr:MAG: glycosyltransferase family 1 protein [Acidobacteriota bacterium]REK01454.1 MAG: glycosyltransferase family 1 protein [Acidobacteriota bacterium]REK14410.1 MAG: glycosyltransferase family 1 protein [Acidobacteriota bacterium]REK45125.1 MAG: glycosyltransferase family 1 protein [Acidobacteriota bacterium]